MGYHIEAHGDGKFIKIFIPNKWIQSPVKYSANPTLDIFLYKNHRGVVRLAENNQYLQWPNAVYKIDKHYPLVKCNFGPIEVYRSGDGVGYCDKLYKNWRTEAVVELRAGPNNMSKDKKVKLPLGLLNVFIPKYNFTPEDLDNTVIDDKTLVPKYANNEMFTQKDTSVNVEKDIKD